MPGSSGHSSIVYGNSRSTHQYARARAICSGFHWLIYRGARPPSILVLVVVCVSFRTRNVGVCKEISAIYELLLTLAPELQPLPAQKMGLKWFTCARID
jgi:hypothetical protein